MTNETECAIPSVFWGPASPEYCSTCRKLHALNHCPQKVSVVKRKRDPYDEKREREMIQRNKVEKIAIDVDDSVDNVIQVKMPPHGVATVNKMHCAACREFVNQPLCKIRLVDGTYYYFPGTTFPVTSQNGDSTPSRAHLASVFGDLENPNTLLIEPANVHLQSHGVFHIAHQRCKLASRLRKREYVNPYMYGIGCTNHIFYGDCLLLRQSSVPENDPVKPVDEDILKTFFN